jgi:hypothetical protein
LENRTKIEEKIKKILNCNIYIFAVLPLIYSMIAYVLRDFEVHYRSKMCITATQGTSIIDICTTMNSLRGAFRTPFFSKAK